VDPTSPPIPVQPVPVQPLPDPGFLGGLGALFGGAMLIVFLIWLAIVVGGILGMYWLIRLAVRHAMRDAARYSVTGTYRKPKHHRPSKPRPVRPWDSPTTPSARPGSIFDDPPRGPRDW
jgi:hypothetical protein